MSTEAADSSSQSQARWRALSATDRRVVGVLVEKAKTTPDQYPMTINGLRTGANQKSNRFPTMALEPEQIESSLERLRQLGAVTEVQDSGRALKYRHRMYEWLGVDKVELAIMAELLLRGAQTVGELRGRAARMEPIGDLAALKPLLDSLKSKGLVVYLTPEGRGSIVTHNLYQPNELERLKQEFQNYSPRSSSDDEASESPSRPSHTAPSSSAAPSHELEQLREEMAEIRSLLAEYQEQTSQLQRELDSLKQQLGVT